MDNSQDGSVDNVSLNSKSHDDYIPGTVNIYDWNARDDQLVKTNKNGLILVPQPSNSVNDPYNWSSLKRYWNLAVLAFITGFTAATSNDAGSVQDSLNQKYGISYDAMNTGAGVLFVGIAWATFILAPSASLYGRKISYFVCIFLGLLGAMWFALTKDTLDSIWLQLFVGISESCAEAQVQLSLTDMFFQHQLGLVLTVYMLATSVGTFMGPLIGGFIVEYAGFRYVGWIAVFISAGLLVVIVFFMHETMFDRRHYKMHSAARYDEKKPHVSVSRVSTDERDIAMAVTNGGREEKKLYWRLVALITPASNLQGWGIKQYLRRLVLLFRVFLFPGCILSGFVWGMQSALLTFYLTVEDDQWYDPPYNYSDTGVALMNVPTLIGLVVGCIYAGVVSDWVAIWMAKRNGGIMEAEFRLYFLLIPAVLCPVGLILFAVGTDKFWPWQPTYVGLGLIGVGYGASGDVALGYLMEAYPDMVVEMMGGVAVINNMIGCIFTFACSPWLSAMGNTHTFIILAVITFLIMGLAAPFIIWGKRMRQWTKPWYMEYCALKEQL